MAAFQFDGTVLAAIVRQYGTKVPEGYEIFLSDRILQTIVATGNVGTVQGTRDTLRMGVSLIYKHNTTIDGEGLVKKS